MSTEVPVDKIIFMPMRFLGRPTLKKFAARTVIAATLALAAVGPANAQSKASSSSAGLPDSIDMRDVVHRVAPEYPTKRAEVGSRAGAFWSGRWISKREQSNPCGWKRARGNTMLDQAATNAFRQWQFKPGTVRQFRTRINYTMAHCG
ncbi:MAG: energy transducer TonB [Chthoniobacterales bacterium]